MSKYCDKKKFLNEIYKSLEQDRITNKCGNMFMTICNESIKKNYYNREDDRIDALGGAYLDFCNNFRKFNPYKRRSNGFELLEKGEEIKYYEHSKDHTTSVTCTVIEEPKLKLSNKKLVKSKVYFCDDVKFNKINKYFSYRDDVILLPKSKQDDLHFIDRYLSISIFNSKYNIEYIDDILEYKLNSSKKIKKLKVENLMYYTCNIEEYFLSEISFNKTDTKEYFIKYTLPSLKESDIKVNTKEIIKSLPNITDVLNENYLYIENESMIKVEDEFGRKIYVTKDQVEVNEPNAFSYFTSVAINGFSNGFKEVHPEYKKKNSDIKFISIDSGFDSDEQTNIFTI